MNLVPSQRFYRDLGKLEKKNERLQKAIGKTMGLLQDNPNHPSLRLHKLSGQSVYSISVTMSIRMLIAFRGDDIHLLRIGTHEDVY
ncbi:plasmid stabilization protein [Candidatus Gottesmanbacteria bacterium]|nr:plasmid stabilization protein [Candidatus Gottesmanbacteria bacterium]